MIDETATGLRSPAAAIRSPGNRLWMPGALATIEQVRVDPLTPAWADALADGDGAFTDRFGVPVEAGWIGFPESLPALLDAARAGPVTTWGSHLFFDDDGALVGIGGWKGPPIDGTAELGYSVAPARQGRGIATAAVRELVTRARAAGVRLVVAHTLPEPSASTSVLSRCGFTRVGDAAIWRWELGLADPPDSGLRHPV